MYLKCENRKIFLNENMEVILIKKNITALILMFIISSYVYSEGGILKKSRTNEGRYRDIEIEYNDAGQILEEVHRDKEGNIFKSKEELWK